MKKPVKPTEPRKPQKTIGAENLIVDEERDGLKGYYSGTIKDLIDACPEGIDLDEVYISVDLGNDAYCRVVYYTDVENPEYDEQMKTYEKALKIYNEKLKEYDENIEAYNKFILEKQIYDFNIEQQLLMMCNKLGIEFKESMIADKSMLAVLNLWVKTI